MVRWIYSDPESVGISDKRNENVYKMYTHNISLPHRHCPNKSLHFLKMFLNFQNSKNVDSYFFKVEMGSEASDYRIKYDRNDGEADLYCLYTFCIHFRYVCLKSPLS